MPSDLCLLVLSSGLFFLLLIFNWEERLSVRAWKWSEATPWQHWGQQSSKNAMILTPMMICTVELDEIRQSILLEIYEKAQVVHRYIRQNRSENEKIQNIKVPPEYMNMTCGRWMCVHHLNPFFCCFTHSAVLPLFCLFPLYPLPPGIDSETAGMLQE